MKPAELKLVRLGIEQGLLGESRRFGYDINKFIHSLMNQNATLRRANSLMINELDRLKKEGKWGGWKTTPDKEVSSGKETTQATKG